MFSADVSIAARNLPLIPRARSKSAVSVASVRYAAEGELAEVIADAEDSENDLAPILADQDDFHASGADDEQRVTGIVLEENDAPLGIAPFAGDFGELGELGGVEATEQGDGGEEVRCFHGHAGERSDWPVTAERRQAGS